jgi:hypothetical protein
MIRTNWPDALHGAPVGVGDRRPRRRRERVVLFNIVTITTLAIGVATLFVALFVRMTLAAAVVIPRSRSSGSSTIRRPHVSPLS